MKRTVFALVIGCSFLTAALFAEDIPAKDVSVQRLLKIVQKEYPKSTVTEDGEIEVAFNKIYIELIPEIKLIHIYLIFKPSALRSKKEMTELANKFNNEKVFLRVYIDEKGRSYCDHYIAYSGGVNSVNFLESISWVSGMMRTWEEKYVAGGEEK